MANRQDDGRKGLTTGRYAEEEARALRVKSPARHRQFWRVVSKLIEVVPYRAESPQLELPLHSSTARMNLQRLYSLPFSYRGCVRGGNSLKERRRCVIVSHSRHEDLSRIATAGWLDIEREI